MAAKSGALLALPVRLCPLQLCQSSCANILFGIITTAGGYTRAKYGQKIWGNMLIIFTLVLGSTDSVSDYRQPVWRSHHGDNDKEPVIMSLCHHFAFFEHGHIKEQMA